MTYVYPLPQVERLLIEAARRAQVAYLVNKPPSALFGRCMICHARLDCDGDCIECLKKQLEKNQ